MAILRVDPFDCQMPFSLDIRDQVQGLNDRDGIPQNSRWVGMRVWVNSENKLYILKTLGDNTGWEQIWPLDASSIQLIQTVTVNTTIPPNGTGINGDIWFRRIAGGVEIYQKVSGVWVNKGLIPTGDTEYINNESLSFDQTSTSLNGLYPDMSIGGQVYSEINNVIFTKISDTKWRMGALDLI